LVLALSSSAFGSDATAAPVEQKSQAVLFNTKTLKFHAASCEWAHKCTRNCVRVSREEAVKRGGMPCKVCGGR
jgi:hypothetical protein